MNMKIEDLFVLAKNKGLFSHNWYVNTYGGKFKNDFESFSDYVKKSNFSPVNPSPKFDNESYHRMYVDVYHSQQSPLVHFLSHGEKEGRGYTTVSHKWSPSDNLNYENSLPLKAYLLKIAVCLHIYYADYIDRFYEALEQLPVKVDVFITLADEKNKEKAIERFSKHPKVNNVFLKCVPNKGRNFGPLLVEFANRLSDYDLFCHLHSKKSLYSGREQTQWSDYLTEYLLRDPAVVTKILNAFLKDPDIGIYYPTTFWMMPSWVNHVTCNKGYMKSWYEKLGLPESTDFLSYPAGGMFWARPKALKGILDKTYTYENFPDEPLPNDGSMLHALERVLGLLAEHNGYSQLFYHPASGRFTKDQSYVVANYQNSLDKMLPHLERIHLLSFDVFDTLVRRKFTVPDYAKLKLGQELVKQGVIANPKDFVSTRNTAEFSLREKAKFQGDVRIEDIYVELAERLNLSKEQGQLLMNREFELDFEMIQPKQEMVDLFNYLGAKGHILWVISDTYYNCKQVGLMLRKVGISVPYRLLVSSAEQKRKDNGSMWQMVKEDLKREGITSYLHIGDNVVADAQLPGDLGLATMHILHPIDKWQALGFPVVLKGDSALDEAEILKWGSLISNIGRTPFLGD